VQYASRAVARASSVASGVASGVASSGQVSGDARVSAEESTEESREGPYRLQIQPPFSLAASAPQRTLLALWAYVHTGCVCRARSLTRTRVRSWRQKTKNVKAIIAWSCCLLESETDWIFVNVSRMFL
jgi:hypothetical protein